MHDAACLACRFDKTQLPAEQPSFGPSVVVSAADAEAERAARNSFNFEIAYIKAQPVRTEPTVILVSCAGAAGSDASDSDDTAVRGAFAGPEANVLGAAEGVNARRVSLKRRGEAGLRSSGLGYCIVRPSQLLQEPGGYKALVFDQGDRIQQVRSHGEPMRAYPCPTCKGQPARCVRHAPTPALGCTGA